MSKNIIEVSKLSKKYKYGQNVQPYYTLRDTLTGVFKKPKHLLSKTSKKSQKREFWALKDVSFKVDEGEVLGIIGPNGAGKSTLLKVLSQITPPTSGKAILRGRVGSLLEVGTGFHQELTGRENIYLNGAVLGMSRREINKKFDEIVDFSGVEKFLDTPVKRYSSGMLVRLGFAVAAHLDPEILLIDEVLAVGDAEFQKKCLKKMNEIATGGRTILFVSHNMDAISKLSKNAVLIKDGIIKSYGNTNSVINKYIKVKYANKLSLKNVKRKGGGKIHFNEVSVNDNNKVISGEKVKISMKYKSSKIDLKNCRIGIAFKDIRGSLLFVCSTEQYFKGSLDLPKSKAIDCIIPNFPLSAGNYYLDLFFEVNREVQDWIVDDLLITVSSGNFFPGGRQQPVGFEGRGVLIKHEWKFN